MMEFKIYFDNGGPDSERGWCWEAYRIEADGDLKIFSGKMGFGTAWRAAFSLAAEIADGVFDKKRRNDASV